MRLFEARWRRVAIGWVVLTPLGAAVEHLTLQVPFVHGLVRMGAMLGAVVVLQYLFRYLDRLPWSRLRFPAESESSKTGERGVSGE